MVAPLIIAGARAVAGKAAQGGASSASRKSVTSQFASRKSITARVGRTDTQKPITQGFTTPTAVSRTMSRVVRQRIDTAQDTEEGGAKNIAISFAKSAALRTFIFTVLPWIALIIGFFVLIGALFTGIFAYGGIVATWSLPDHFDLLFYGIAGLITFMTYLVFHYLKSS